MLRAHFDVRNARDREHAADKEAGEDVVMVQVFTQPHLDLCTATHTTEQALQSTKKIAHAASASTAAA